MATTKRAPRKKAVKPNKFIAIDVCNGRYIEFDNKEQLDDRLADWISNECCDADDVEVIELVNVIHYDAKLDGVTLTPRKK